MANRNNPDFLSASTIEGDKVVNRDGEDLGNIEDLMIDIEDGRVAYAELSFGGFLGMGDKLFAIPWKAFSLKLHDHAFILDVDKEVLENAEGFDKDNRPLVDRQWASSTYRYYGYHPYWRTETTERAETQREIESERVSRMETAGRDSPDFLSADTIKGNKVVNKAGDDIGKIDEIMIDLQDGKVAYVVVSHGGILGIGTKLFAIPWQAFSPRMRDRAFVLDIPKETFDKAEGFDKGNWPLTREEISRTYDYYGYQPYWQIGTERSPEVSTGVQREIEPERMARMERDMEGPVRVEEERMAQQERERLEGLKERQEEKVSRLEEERIESERQTETERERLARLEREQMELERQAEAEREKLVRLERELQEAIRKEETEKVSRLEREVNEIRMQEETRRERLSQLERERERAGREVETEQEKLARLERERVEAQRREEAERERLARLEREKMETEKQVDTEQGRLARLERERIEAERRHETEQEKLTGLERERVEAERWREPEPARMVQTEGVISSRENPDFLSASTLEGDKVVNTAGDDLGNIEELMIDLRDGRVAYAVLSFGGFLGIGDKLFAIPWEAMSMKMHDHAFVLDIPKETLENAEGFDKDNWPVTDREWASSVHSYYGYRPYWERETVERTGLPGEIGSERASKVKDISGRENPDFLSASTITGDKVVNTAGDDLGKIEELMIDLRNGRVAYAVLSFGGFLGMSDKLFAIPWQALSLRVHEHAFVLDVSKDVLENAEGFDKDNWPLTRQELSRTYTYYGYQPYWQTAEQIEVSTGTPRETEPRKTERMERQVEEPPLETAEERMARQDKERIEKQERTETDKEKLERLEKERMIAERRESKYK